jgi:hypothetical protein
MLLTVDASTFRPMKTERKQISLPPECRCEQIDEREREHWLDAIAHGNTPENKPKEREGYEENQSEGVSDNPRD